MHLTFKENLSLFQFSRQNFRLKNFMALHKRGDADAFIFLIEFVSFDTKVSLFDQGKLAFEVMIEEASEVKSPQKLDVFGESPHFFDVKVRNHYVLQGFLRNLKYKRIKNCLKIDPKNLQNLPEPE